MAFTAEDAEAVHRWLTQHAPAAACPLCRMAGDWQFGTAVALPGLPDDSPWGPLAMTAVPIVCKHCGHIEFLSPDVMGL